MTLALYVNGDADAIGARIMARLIPDARVHVYHDGHLALVTNPGALAPVIVEFLRGHE